jgi:hypothetical protein
MKITYLDPRANQLHKRYPNSHTVILINDDTITCCSNTIVYHFTPESKPAKEKQRQKQGKSICQRENFEKIAGKEKDRHHRKRGKP